MGVSHERQGYILYKKDSRIGYKLVEDMTDEEVMQFLKVYEEQNPRIKELIELYRTEGYSYRTIAEQFQDF